MAPPALRAGHCTGSRTTSTSTAVPTGRARSPRPTSGPQRQITPSPPTRPCSAMPPMLAACTVTLPSSTRTPPPAATPTLFPTSATLRIISAVTTAPRSGRPRTPPSTTRASWPRCWAACFRRARRNMSPHWPSGPPRRSLSTTRPPWPGCWTACGGRARRGRSSSWAGGPPRTFLWTRSPWRGRRTATHAPWPGCWTACGRRARTSRSPRWLSGPPRRSPSTTRPRWPGGCSCRRAGCCLYSRRSRSPRCCAVIPPPTPPSATRPRWRSCWTACGRRALRSKSPSWPGGPPRRFRR